MSDIPDKIYVCKETNGYGLCAEYANYPSSKLEPYIKASLVKDYFDAIQELENLPDNVSQEDWAAQQYQIK